MSQRSLPPSKSRRYSIQYGQYKQAGQLSREDDNVLYPGGPGKELDANAGTGAAALVRLGTRRRE